MPMSASEYFNREEWRMDYANLTKELHNLSHGRNGDCFPLVAFGWKHADLDPEGCTGIKSIESMDDEKIVVRVGGHKTFVPSSREEPEFKSLTEEELTSALEVEGEYITHIPYPGYWSGDDWTVHIPEDEKEICVRWILDDTLAPDYERTARLIVLKARRHLRDFHKTMAQAHEEFYEAAEIMREWAKQKGSKKTSRNITQEEQPMKNKAVIYDVDEYGYTVEARAGEEVVEVYHAGNHCCDSQCVVALDRALPLSTLEVFAEGVVEEMGEELFGKGNFIVERNEDLREEMRAQRQEWEAHFDTNSA